MQTKKIQSILNQENTKPIVSNLSAYPWYTSPEIIEMPKFSGGWDANDTPPKKNVPIDSCELFVFTVQRIYSKQ
jgi:hypothetical protein